MPDRAGVRWLARVFRPAETARQARLSLRYTASEVKQSLRHTGTDVRAQRIHECVARLGASLDDLAVRQRFRGLEDYHRRLLRILTLYCRGWEVGAIAADLSLFSTGVGVECAIDTAATIIAEQLNRQVAA